MRGVRRKVALLSKNQDARLAWALEHIDWTDKQ
jgi:hypothetical protein